MRFKLTLVLFVLNALAFLTIHYWTDEIGLGQETASGVTGWDSSEILAINRIEMSGALLDAPRILEKKNNQWASEYGSSAKKRALFTAGANWR